MPAYHRTLKDAAREVKKAERARAAPVQVLTLPPDAYLAVADAPIRPLACAGPHARRSRPAATACERMASTRKLMLHARSAPAAVLSLMTVL